MKKRGTKINLFLKIVLVFALTSPFFTCGRIDRKVKKCVKSIKECSSDRLDLVVEKVFPPFDSDRPDTENNRQRFEEFIGVELTPDVKNIYCFDDAIGADADYMFAFNCSPYTSEKIIILHGLTIDTINSDNGFFMQNDFDWWDKETIKNLQKYSSTDGDGNHKYYWYDSSGNKAYFFKFDM